MAIALDVANVGQNFGNNGGAANFSSTVTTGSAVASGARVFAAFHHDTGGDTSGGQTGCTGGGLTWTLVGDGHPSFGANYGALWYADAPAGLASSTVITMTTNLGTTWDWAVVVSSYKATSGFVLDVAADVVVNNGATAWASGTKVTSAPALVIALCASRDSNTNAPTSPAVEDQDKISNACETIIERRIESSAGSYTVAGTVSTTPASNGIVVVTAAYREAAGGASGPPFRAHRMPLGV